LKIELLVTLNDSFAKLILNITLKNFLYISASKIAGLQNLFARVLELLYYYYLL
jgi:hypothetical protein